MSSIHAPKLHPEIAQKILLKVITKIRESLDLEIIFKSTAQEVREALQADRVGVFQFDPNSNFCDGQFVSEAVLPPFDSAMTAKVHDHCFGEQYAVHYQQGRIQVISNIYQAGLKDCHQAVLEQFQIQAQIIVPLHKGTELWGLLCIHQCDRPRTWDAADIQLVQHVAEHFSVAIRQSELLTQTQNQAQELRQLAQQRQILFHVVTKIRASLDLDAIFQTAAKEVRQALDADRVGVFRFTPGSNYCEGEFISEAVLPNFSSAMAAKIHDHCFGEQYAVHYAAGRMQIVADLQQAELQDCHIAVLTQFQIKAQIIAPLCQGTELWGLLCIHQCDQPRHWKNPEIQCVQQVAAQLGVALQQSDLLSKSKAQAQDLVQTLANLQKTQLQLIQAGKMASLGQLVAGVAHEINNPVNFIHGNLKHANRYTQDLLELVKLFQQHCPTPPSEIQQQIDAMELDFMATDVTNLLESMQSGTKRIQEIVQSLRNFSRLDESDFKAVDLHEGLDSTLMLLKHRFQAHPDYPGIEIVRDYDPLPLVECYASSLNQVFMNLLGNAIDALEKANAHRSDQEIRERPNRITLRTTAIGSDWVEIRIIDNGAGIDEETQAHIFDPFFTTKPVGKGIGMGLSISYQIVTEQHGGKLTCHSVPDQGTELILTIPCRQIGSRV